MSLRPPEHPYRKHATAQLRRGLVATGLGIGLIVVAVLAFPPLALAGAVLVVNGAVVAFLAAHARRQCDAMFLLNPAYDLLARGELAKAEAIASRVPSTAGSVGAAVLYLRATIAFHRADLVTAEAMTSEAIATPAHWLERDPSPPHRLLSHGLRALVRSSLGKDEEAAEDIACVRRGDDASVEAISVVAIAEMIGLAKRGEHRALARLVDDSRALVDFVPPRARVLVSAFRRMLAVTTSSAYREPGRVEDTTPFADIPLAAWTATIAPEATVFLPETIRRSTTTTPELAHPGSIGTSTKIPPTRGGSVFLVAAALVLFTWLTHTVIAGENLFPSEAFDRAFSLALGAIAGIFMAGVLFVRVKRALDSFVTGQRALRRAMRKVGDGRDGEAERLLQDIERAGPPGNTAAAQLALAELAERHAKMTTALEFCDAGLAALGTSPNVSAMHGDLLRPELVAERAFVLAVLGRKKEADAALVSLATEYPAFAYLTRSIFRVQLVLALGAAGTTRAHELAGERTPDLPLTWREEILADIVVALETGHPPERERLRRELASDAELARWIDVVLPRARTALPGTSPTQSPA